MFKNKPTNEAWNKMSWVLDNNKTSNIAKFDWGYTFTYNDNVYGMQDYYLFYDAENSRVVSAQLSKRNHWEV